MKPVISTTKVQHFEIQAIAYSSVNKVLGNAELAKSSTRADAVFNDTAKFFI